MNRGFSIYLDLLRFAAAMVVFISHYAYPRFSGGGLVWIRELNLGSDAVVLFFVLSGFVIAFAADRDAGLSSFAFKRITRLWSVLLPALVLTFLLDRWGAKISPSDYENDFYNPIGLGEMFAKGGFFANEWSFWTTRLGSNGPLWSVSYEAAYYLLFAIVFYMTGLRRALILIVAMALVGLNVLLLMPAWLIGVWLWQKCKEEEAVKLSTSRVWMLALAGPALYFMLLLSAIPDFLRIYTLAFANVFLPEHMLRFSDEFIWNALIGVFFAMHLFGVRRLLQEQSLAKFAEPIRWLAGASFSIYAAHYPIMMFTNAVLPDVMPLRGWVFFWGTLGICLIFAQLFERPLGTFRRYVLRLAGRPQVN